MSNTQRKLPISILIIDDSKDVKQNIRALKSVFSTSKFNFSAHPVGSGEEALEIMSAPERERYFDVALVDQNLPKMSGIDFSKELYKINPWMPIVLFTGQDLSSELEEEIKKSTYIFHYILKGIEVSQLASYCLAAILDRDDRWWRFLNSLSQGLHSLEQNRVLDSCEAGLKRLGYQDYEIAWFEHAGWVVTDPAHTRQENLSRKILRQCGTTRNVEGSHLLLEKQEEDVIAPDDPEVMPFARTPDSYKDSIVPFPGGFKVPLVKEVERTNFNGDGVRRAFGELVLYGLPTPPGGRERRFLEMLGMQMAAALENANTYQQREDQRSVLNKIIDTNHRILRLLAEKHEASNDFGDYLQEMLDTFAQAIADTLKFERVYISLAHKSPGTKLDTFGLVGLGQAQIDELRTGGIPLDLFIKLHKYAYVDDTGTGKIYFIPHGRYDKAEYEAPIYYPPADANDRLDWHPEDILRTEIIGPDNNVLGYITVDLPTLEYASNMDLFQALRTFATQIATHYTLALAQRDEKAAYDRLKVIKDSIVEISAISDRSALGTTLDSILLKLKYSGFLAIMLYNPEPPIKDQEIDVVYVPRDSPDYSTHRKLSKDEGIAGNVIRSKEWRWFNNWAQITEFLSENGIEQKGEKTESLIAVPLLIEDEAIGALLLQDYHKPNAYSEHDLTSLLTLAAPIALALRRIEKEEKKLLESFESVSKLAVELIGREIDQKEIEKEILEEACNLTKASMGVIFTKDADRRVLVASTWWPPANEAGKKAFTLALDSRGENYPSLSAYSANHPEEKILRFNNSTNDEENFELIPDSKHTVAIPLVVGGEHGQPQIVLGVMTLESSQENDVFHKWHEGPLTTLAAYVVQARLRAEAKEDRDRTTAWAMYNLSAQIFKHNTPSKIVTVKTSLSNMKNQMPKLKKDFEPIVVGADNLVKYEHIDMLRLEPVYIPEIIIRFRSEYEAELKKSNGSCPRIDIINRMPHDTLASTNRQGLSEILRIILEDPVQEILASSYGVGKISISVVPEDNWAMICVNHPGEKLSDDTMRLIAEDDWRSERELRSLYQVNLMQAKLLARILGATIKASQNSRGDTEWTIRLPSSQPMLPASLLLAPDAQTYLRQVQQRIASREALRYVDMVRESARSLSSTLYTLETLSVKAENDMQVLESEIKNDIKKKQTFSLNGLLDGLMKSFTEKDKEQIRLIEMPPSGVRVHANEIGLRNMIKQIIENAQQEIAKSGVGNIDIRVKRKTEPACVEIHIHNTGSYIKNSSQILRAPVKSSKKQGKGMNLYINRLLAQEWGGTLELTGNYKKATADQEQGVTFTITLQTSTKKPLKTTEKA